MLCHKSLAVLIYVIILTSCIEKWFTNNWKTTRHEPWIVYLLDGASKYGGSTAWRERFHLTMPSYVSMLPSYSDSKSAFICPCHFSTYVLQSTCVSIFAVCDWTVSVSLTHSSCLVHVICTFVLYSIYVLRSCYAQSHSDDSHVHPTAPCCTHALSCSYSGSPHNVMYSFSC